MRAWMPLVIVAAITAGCGSTPSTSNDIDFSSGPVAIPSLRVSADLSRSQFPPSEPHSGHAIEVELTGANATDTRTLAAGATPLGVGGQFFSGSQELRAESSFRFGEVAYRYRKFFGGAQAFGIELLAGIARAQLGLTVSGVSQSGNERFGDDGAAGSVGGVWRLRERTSLQARYLVFLSKSTEAYRLELQMTQALARNAALRAGVAKWHIDLEGDQRGSSRATLGVRFWGPTVGLDLMF